MTKKQREQIEEQINKEMQRVLRIGRMEGAILVLNSVGEVAGQPATVAQLLEGATLIADVLETSIAPPKARIFLAADLDTAEKPS